MKVMIWELYFWYATIHSLSIARQNFMKNELFIKIQYNIICEILSTTKIRIWVQKVHILIYSDFQYKDKVFFTFIICISRR